jgi:hypothetical protein
LPLQRHKDPEVLPSKEQPCSSSGRTEDALAQGVHESVPRPGRDPEENCCSTSGNVGQELTFRLSKEPFPSSQASTMFAHKAEPVALPSASGSESFSLPSPLRGLIQNWVPPPIQNLMIWNGCSSRSGTATMQLKDIKSALMACMIKTQLLGHELAICQRLIYTHYHSQCRSELSLE